MLMIITSVFAYIVVAVFTIYCIFTKSYEFEEFWTAIIYGVDCTFYTSFLVAVLAIASNLTYKGKFTATLIHKAISRTDDEKVNEKLKVWSMQLLHRQPIVTCGLFAYDWSLFYSVIMEGDFRGALKWIKVGLSCRSWHPLVHTLPF